MNFPVSVITDMDVSPESHYIHRSKESKELYSQIVKPQTLKKIKDEINSDWTNEQAKEHFTVWEYTEEQVLLIKVSDVEKEKKEEYQDGKEAVKGIFRIPLDFRAFNCEKYVERRI